MKDDLVPIYLALTVDDAQRLADKLRVAGIESFVDQTDSPMYGATQGPSSRIVRVRRVETGPARDVMKRFGFKYHPSMARQEWQREETGLELPTREKPSDDSPHEFEGEGNERLDTDRPGPPSEELMDMITETGEERDLSADEIESYETDRPIAQDADIDRDEIAETRIDDLDVERDFDERETGTPSANLRGEEERRERERRGF